MLTMLGNAALLAALVAVAVMGFAIQRGATCTVAAVAELVNDGRARRIAALLESALWVSAGLIVAHATGLSMAAPVDHPLTAKVLIGGALLGLGAVLAGACVFGAIARLGQGEWGYAGVPAGYLLGCLVADRLGLLAPSPVLPMAPPPPMPSAWLAVVIVILAATRLALLTRRQLPGQAPAPGRPKPLWDPHVATIVIALAFVFVLFFAGAWAYTDALAGLARGRTDALAPQLLLLAAMAGGSWLAAWRAGRLTSRWPDARELRGAVGGGLLMALGSLLIPGSNDGLILLGLPHFHAYAWAAMAAMVVTISVALRLRRLAGG